MTPLTQNKRTHKDVIIFAYDGMTLAKSIELTKLLAGRMYAVKIHSLYDELGKTAIDELKIAGATRVWDDAKLHDIPDTVKYRARAIFGNGADIITVHASGDIQMMQSAVMSGKEVYGISVLTSLDNAQSDAIYNKEPAGQVLTLARFAKLAGLTGLVCSAQEVAMLRKMSELDSLKLVIPGTRSAGADLGNQKRPMTPREAILAGATHLVIGTQVTKALDPVAAFDAVAKEIDEALTELEKQTIAAYEKTPPKVFSIKEESKLVDIIRADFGPVMTEEAFDYVFKVAKAGWVHNGNPKNRHAVLTSGRHSNGFVDTLKVLRYTNLCTIFAKELANIYRLYAKEHNLPLRPDWVVGSDHAGAAFSQAVATELGSKHDFTEKGPDDTQLWKRHTIGFNETVLRVEELMTTAKTLAAVTKGVREGNANPVVFLPVALVGVHRSDVVDFEGSKILSLRHYDIASWEATECPLCQSGSEAVEKVKIAENWEKLTTEVV